MGHPEHIPTEGKRKAVEGVEGNPDVVRATFKNPDYALAKGTYLLAKLSHIFFPQATPRPIAFGKNSDGKYTMDMERADLDVLHLKRQAMTNMTEAERAALPEAHDEHEKTYYLRRYEEGAEERNALRDAFKKAGIPIDPTAYLNWTLAGGTTVHVDTSEPWNEIASPIARMFDEDQIRAHITTLEQEKQAEAVAILDELVALEKHLVV